MAHSRFRTIRKDLERYANLKYLTGQPKWRRYLSGLIHRGFRVVLYYRLGNSVCSNSQILRFFLMPFLFIVRLVLQPEISCEIPAECDIGEGLFLPHPYGITIAPQSRIKKNCNIFSGVVIGINHLANREGPVIGDNVTIYAGAKVIGQVQIGSRVVVGANSVVLKDIPEGAIVAGVPMLIIRFRKPDDTLEF